MLVRILQSLALLLVLAVNNAYAVDITEVIAQNIKGTTILNMYVAPIAHDDSMLLVVTTSAGERKFIVTRDNIVSAIAMLQNPEAYGAKNGMAFRSTMPHIPANQPLIMTRTQSPIMPTAPLQTGRPLQGVAPTTAIASAAPVQTGTPVIPVNANMVPSNAPAIVSSVVLSANQQASK